MSSGNESVNQKAVRYRDFLVVLQDTVRFAMKRRHAEKEGTELGIILLDTAEASQEVNRRS